MIFVKLCLYSILILRYTTDTSKKDIVIVGQAYNEKDGAWVSSKRDNRTYFLDGVEEWDEKIVGRTVKVWGKLLIKDVKEIPRKPGEIVRQQMIGTRRTILKAKWKLIK